MRLKLNRLDFNPSEDKSYDKEQLGRNIKIPAKYNNSLIKNIYQLIIKVIIFLNNVILYKCYKFCQSYYF